MKTEIDSNILLDPPRLISGLRSRTDARRTMRATVFHGPNDIRVEEVPRPNAGIGEAVIRITLTTICGTDLHILRGEYVVKPGLVIGHESVGVIEALGLQETFENCLRCLRPGGTLSSLGVYSGKLQILAEAAMRIALTIQRSTVSALVQQADKIAKLDAAARKALSLEAVRPQMIVNVALLAGAGRLAAPPYVAPGLPAVESLTLATHTVPADD